jgi:hypothetical protein
MALHRNEKTPTAETKAKRSLANHCRVGRGNKLLKPTNYGLVEALGLEIH